MPVGALYEAATYLARVLKDLTLISTRCPASTRHAMNEPITLIADSQSYSRFRALPIHSSIINHLNWIRDVVDLAVVIHSVVGARNLAVIINY